MVDCAVIGQGIAGTCMVHALLERGLTVRVFDDKDGHTASLRAAGVINPITGRRFVKTWRADQVIPGAYKFYSNLSAKMETEQLVLKRGVLHAMSEPIMEENWLLRQGDESYAPFMGGLKRIDKKAFGGVFGEVKGGLQVRMPEVLSFSKRWFDNQGVARSKVLRHYTTRTDELAESLDAQTVIFCEGAAVADNTHFNFLPHKVAKGEAIICHIPNLRSQYILKGDGGISIVPLWEEDVYWVGSTYEWDVYDPTPTNEAREVLEVKMSMFLKCDHEIVDHIAGIRPTTKDRRPYVGVHPDCKDVYLLNGLGTKGASLAPYCASAIADHIVSDTPIPEGMNLLRYYKS